MVLTGVSIANIDTQVKLGLPIGHYSTGDDLSVLPKMLGDWNIKTITEDRNPGSGYIVAIPSNLRTRLIYKSGRIAWLMALGFNEERALLYYRASNRVKKKWDLKVALFVMDHFTMDHFNIDLILLSPNPKKVCESLNIYPRLSQHKILAGCQILANIKGLK